MEEQSTSKRGQSLVEMAVILPILLMMMLGVFEVGWVLRGYLTLSNVNREAARFVARGVFLDFSRTDEPAQIGYEKVITHTTAALGGQLGMTFTDDAGMGGYSPNANASMIVTYYSIDPETFRCPGGDTECQAVASCEDTFAVGNITDAAMSSELNRIEYPVLVQPDGYTSNDFADKDYVPADKQGVPAYYDTRATELGDTDVDDIIADNIEGRTAYAFHTGGPYFSSMDPVEQLKIFVSEANITNCELKRRGLSTSEIDIVVVENTYYLEQLTGLIPFLGRRIPLYSRTVMRVTTNLRDVGDDEDDDVCKLHPIMIPNSEVSPLQFGDVVNINISTQASRTAQEAVVTHWDYSAGPSGSQLESDFQNTGNAETLYTEYRNTSNKQLAQFKWITIYNGAPIATVETGLVNARDNTTTMIMPVWNDAACLGGGTCTDTTEFVGGAYGYNTWSFVKMIPTSVNCGGSSCDVEFSFQAFDPTACTEETE